MSEVKVQFVHCTVDVAETMSEFSRIDQNLLWTGCFFFWLAFITKLHGAFLQEVLIFSAC